MITVYTTPSCVKCTATKRELVKRGHQFTEVTITPEIAAELKADGYTQAPVVIAENDAWDGFRPDRSQNVSDYSIAVAGRDSTNPVIIATVEHHSIY